MRKRTIQDRVELHSVRDSRGCLIWMASKTKFGYGTTCINRKKVLMHRAVWEFYNGPIKHSMCVCHRCDEPSCVNIEHLFLGSHMDNMEDMVTKKRHWRLFGEHSKKSKVSDSQVMEMRMWYGAGEVSVRSIGIEYGMTEAGAQSIISGRTRKWTKN